MLRQRFFAGRAWLLPVLAVVLAACGDTDVNLDTGPDFSDSPLRVSTLTPARSITLFWEAVEGATHYRLFEDPDGESDGSLDFVQLGSDLQADTLQFVYQVAVHLYDWENARFMLQACTAGGCEEIGQQQVRGLSAASIGRFSPASSGFDAAFGFSLALSGQGDTLVAGAIGTSVFLCEEIFPVEVAPGETELEPCEYNQDLPPEQVEELVLTEAIIDAGAATVLAFVGGTWVEQDFIKAPNIEAGDLFGTSVALSEDGSTLVISAVGEDSSATGINADQDNNAAPDSGAVYVYQRETSGDEANWILEAYIKASNTAEGAQFGSTVTLAADGRTLVVGAPGEDSAAVGIDGDQSGSGAENSGAVYIFVRDLMGNWSQQAYIKAANTGADDAFGGSVAISADGNRLAVGAPFEDSAAAGIDGDPFNDALPDSGAVYVFDRIGEVWAQTAYIKAAAPDAGDRFGWSVAMNAAGSRLAVGAPREDSRAVGVNGNALDNRGINVGAAYLFENDGAGWAQTTYFKASNSDDVDEFGFSVSLSQSGDSLLASAWRESSNAVGINGNQLLDFAVDSGAAYLFVRDGGVWSQKSYIKAAQNNFNLRFGWDTAIAQDGDLLAISARGQGGIVFIY